MNKIYQKKGSVTGKQFYELFRKHSRNGQYRYGQTKLSVCFHSIFPDNNFVNHVMFQYDAKHVACFINVEEKEFLSKFHMSIDIFGIDFIDDYTGKLYMIEGSLKNVEQLKKDLERITKKECNDLQMRVYGQIIPKREDKEEALA